MLGIYRGRHTTQERSPHPTTPIPQVYYIASCERGFFNGWLVNQWSGAGVPLCVRMMRVEMAVCTHTTQKLQPLTKPPQNPTHLHSSLSCGNMTGTVSPKGDVAMILSKSGAWTTPWPVATVMFKAGKLRTLVQASIVSSAGCLVWIDPSPLCFSSHCTHSRSTPQPLSYTDPRG